MGPEEIDAAVEEILQDDEMPTIDSIKFNNRSVSVQNYSKKTMHLKLGESVDVPENSF